MKGADFINDDGSEIRSDARRRLRGWRSRLLWQRLLHTLAAIAILLLVGHWFDTPLTTLLQQVLALALVWFAQLWISPKWRNLSTENFLLHLNRRFPDFEESTQLLGLDTSELSPMQLLQRERVLAVYPKNIAQAERWQAPLHYRTTMGVSVLCCLLFMFTDQLASLAGGVLPDSLMTPSKGLVPETESGLHGISIRIEPPAYTGLAVIETDQMDLELPQGSLVDWNLSFATNDGDYVFQLSGDKKIALEPGNEQGEGPGEYGQLHASGIVEETSLYRIVRTDTGKEPSAGEIYSLTVKLDQAPDIRIIQPRVTSLEIPKDGPARFSSQALVKDDYGVEGAGILASVAKGSGEGVKFRDETMKFDHSVETDKGLLFTKEWDLKALGMEPGDEVYFTIVATDNRQPEANTGRSETLIVRWLDDQPAGLAADGLAIDFIPEFFKSQRQIIIDTEQLLEDEPHLTPQDFKDSSYQTGQAQADLKQKYGQYLGDEFAEGPDKQLTGVTDETNTSEDAHDHDEDDHGSEINSSGMGKSLSNMTDVVRLFGHDHGDPEIGPITKRNPVALMKRAVNEMWQAERHLMQAEPALALPFEYEAYKYLKLARQADRIYVKRLGFEPPPVSEDRRLTGELDEIINDQQASIVSVIDPGSRQWVQNNLKAVYHTLTTHSSEYLLDENERGLLSTLSLEFTRLSQQRAALIRHAATLEKLSLAGQLKLAACESCLPDLKRTIWNLIEEGPGQLHHRDSSWYADDELIQSYQRAKQTENRQTKNKPGAETAQADRGR